MHIKTIENLWLTSNGLEALQKGKTKSSLIGITQGDLDGACGPYALMMALIASGAISRTDAENIWHKPIKGTTKLAKEIKKLETLLKEGTDNTTLVKLFEAIQRYFPKHSNLQKLKATEINDSGNKLIPFLIEQIDHSLPTIIGLDWRGGGAHWVTVIGYQKFDERSEYPERILVLDPQSRQSKISAWNGILDVHNLEKGKKPNTYWVENYSNTCSIDSGVQFQLTS